MPHQGGNSYERGRQRLPFDLLCRCVWAPVIEHVHAERSMPWSDRSNFKPSHPATGGNIRRQINTQGCTKAPCPSHPHQYRPGREIQGLEADIQYSQVWAARTTIYLLWGVSRSCDVAIVTTTPDRPHAGTCHPTPSTLCYTGLNCIAHIRANDNPDIANGKRRIRRLHTYHAESSHLYLPAFGIIVGELGGVAALVRVTTCAAR